MLIAFVSSQPNGAPVSVWCVMTEQVEAALVLQSPRTRRPPPVESDPGVPRSVEPRCETTRPEERADERGRADQDEAGLR